LYNLVFLLGHLTHVLLIGVIHGDSKGKKNQAIEGKDDWRKFTSSE
jgi:hypothetical protein